MFDLTHYTQTLYLALFLYKPNLDLLSSISLHLNNAVNKKMKSKLHELNAL
jgi:hypothetical protein